MKSIQLIIKRIIDIVFSILGIIILSPLMIIVAILVRTNLGSPIFFKQERVGKNGKVFTMIKFRSMTNDTDKFGILLNPEERLNKFGKILRSTSIDELPELINVLRGDMSLVGPRPLLTQYRPYYSKEQFRRHEVTPGITGWAQINGRNSITWEEKFKLDVWYVDNMSLLLDLKILLITILKIVRRSDINNKDGEIVEFFKGGNKNHE